MAVPDTIPSTLQVKSRDQWVAYRLRSYGNRLAVNNPAADISQATAPGSDAWLDSMATADCLAVMSANSQAIAGTALIANMSEAQLIVKGQDLGVPWPDATGAAGYVAAQTGTNGGKFQPGDLITNLSTRMRYECVGIADVVYYTGDPIPIRGLDTGPASNADPGTQLTWDSPRSGTFAGALVLAQPDGISGLSGGSEKLSIEEYRGALTYAQANESASGNEAAVIKWAQDSLHHGVPVEKAFAYPAIYGCGTTGFCFTVTPTKDISNRIPNGTQMSLVLAYVQSQLPGDDGIIISALSGSSPLLIGRIDWADGSQWADFSPWPNYVSAAHLWIVSSVTDATHFTVDSQESGVSNYSGDTQPSIGMSIALFNPTTGLFVKKVIASFTGTGPWAITCDTSSVNGSDTAYTPVALITLVSPWSDSLADVAKTLIDYINKMGPGEQATPLGDGRKQLRTPRPTAREWPITITSKIEGNVTDMLSVDSFSLVYGLGTTVPMGVPAAISNLFSNPNIALYPL